MLAHIEFSIHYQSTQKFVEMHVGVAAGLNDLGGIFQP